MAAERGKKKGKASGYDPHQKRVKPGERKKRGRDRAPREPKKGKGSSGEGPEGEGKKKKFHDPADASEEEDEKRDMHKKLNDNAGRC